MPVPPNRLDFACTVNQMINLENTAELDYSFYDRSLKLSPINSLLGNVGYGNDRMTGKTSETSCVGGFVNGGGTD